MYQKIIQISFIFVLLIASACNDFLDRQPLVDRVESNFYQTQKDAEEAVVAMYDVLGWGTGWGNEPRFCPFQMLADISSDDSFAGGASRSDIPEIIEIDRHAIRPANETARGIWRINYVGIYRANILLERIEDISPIQIDADFKTRAIAEAKFLRAYYYFNLLRTYENVPLILRPLSGLSEANQPQATPKQVYDQIAKDLVEAAADLPASVAGNERGRATKWAAKALLGRVFLYVNGVYDDNLTAGTQTISQATALAELEEVISTGGFGLLPNYADNFRPAGEFGVESVFEIIHSDARNWFDWGFIIGGEGNIAAQMQGPRVNDPNLEDYERGWSFAPVTQELYDAFENGDLRKSATIIEETQFNSGVTNGFQHTGYFTNKYTTTKAYLRSQGQLEHNWGNNYRVIRFADVLLMAAELGSPNAQQYLSDVRARAGLGAVPATLENILKERRVELAMEGHRYWDLLRTGTAAQNITISGQRGSMYAGDDQDFDITFNATRRGFFPIPQTEIDLVGGLYQQNVGY